MSAGGPYETKQNILTFIQKVNNKIVLSDITDAVYNSATEMINYKTDTNWEIFSGSQILNGTGENHVFSRIVPIVTLTNVVIIAKDETETELIVSGIDRQVWFNRDTGLIERISIRDDIRVTGSSTTIATSPVFPQGIENIRITGTFGRVDGSHESVATLALLQTLIVMKQMGFMFPTLARASDLIQERIGEYEYRVGDMQYSNLDKNQKLTLDGYIAHLFDCLPKDDKIWVEAV